MNRFFKNRFLAYTIIITGVVYFSYLKFIIISYGIYYILLLLSIIFSLTIVFGKKEKLYPFLRILYVSFMTSLSLYFLIAYFIGNHNSIVTYNVPLNGYYTRKVDGIIFEFKGRAVNRPTSKLKNVMKKESNDLLDKYLVSISVSECFTDCYLIRKIDLIRR